MIEIPDVNVLVALHVIGHEFHSDAVRWLAETSQFATTPTTEMGFVRLLMQPRIAGIALSPATAAEALARLKAQPHAVFFPDSSPVETSHFWYAITGPKQVTDIHLLDIAKLRDGVLVSFDRKLAAALRPRDRKFLKVIGGPSD